MWIGYGSRYIILIVSVLLFPIGVEAQTTIPDDYRLVWQDEFDRGDKPNPEYWSFELGFVRNHELQWYLEDNASLQNGLLVLEGKKEQIRNPAFAPGTENWRNKSEYAEYTSASINTKGKFSFQYGILEVRAKIDTSMGMWPAIWTLGDERPWPANGEIDVLEFYRRNDNPIILANAAWAGENVRAQWDESVVPLEELISENRAWPDNYHIWKMDWTESYIRLYLDESLLNEIDLSETINPDGFNPFHQPHYILLNLAIGSNGGDPSSTNFPKQYLVDYVRVYQRE